MSSTKPTVVVVTEKPSIVRALAPYLSRRWPEHRVLAIMTMYLGLYEFRYPRGLAADAYPVITDPRWKPRRVERPVIDVHQLAAEMAIPGGFTRRADQDPVQALQEADEIVFAADPDPSGAVAFHVMLEQALGASAAAVVRPMIFLPTLAPEEIERAVAAPGSTAEPAFQEWLRAGQARRFFDYNFNVNSLSVLGEALKRTSMHAAQMAPHVGMSKYGLQLLYFLRGKTFDAAADVILAMHRWQGTGKYGKHPSDSTQLGTAASQQQILTNLITLGLIACPRKQDRLRCDFTDAGTAFLDMLHPDCEDADLPFRLRQWEAEWPASRPTMERYLRTFFGKQRRFARPS